MDKYKFIIYKNNKIIKEQKFKGSSVFFININNKIMVNDNNKDTNKIQTRLTIFKNKKQIKSFNKILYCNNNKINIKDLFNNLNNNIQQTFKLEYYKLKHHYDLNFEVKILIYNNNDKIIKTISKKYKEMFLFDSYVVWEYILNKLITNFK